MQTKRIRIDYKMIFFALVVGISLIGSTGFAKTYGLNDIFSVLLVVCLLSLFINKRVINEQKYLFVFISIMTLYCVLVSIFCGEFEYGIKFMGTISVILGLQYAGENLSKLGFYAWIFSAMSLVLMIDNYLGGITAGWDSNEICIAGMFSIYWAGIASRAQNKKWNKIVLWAVILFMVMMSFLQQSKSGLLAIAVFVGMDFYIGREKTKNKQKKSDLIFLVLLFMPVISVSVIMFLYQMPIADQLNQWFTDFLGKPFFTGRETLWFNVYTVMMKGVYLFGHGEDTIINLHSVYMNVLYNYGILGVLFYFGFITAVYIYIRKYINDSVVRIALIGYESVYILLMFETRILNVNKINVLPYLLLAVAVGRVIRIKKREALSIKRS